MLPAKFRESVLLGVVTVVAAVAGWWSKPSRKIGPSPSSTPPPAESIVKAQGPNLAAAGEPTKAAAGHFSELRFSRAAEFDRLFEATKGTINRQLVVELHAALQGLESKEYELAIGHVLRTRGEDYDYYEIAGLIASAWAEHDLEAARDWLMRTPHIPGNFMCFEEAILEPWSHRDNAGMFRWLLEHAAEIPPSRKDAMGALLVKLAAEGDAEGGLQLLARIAPDRRSGIFGGWAVRDPAAAAARALAESTEWDRKVAVKAVVNSWARTEQGTSDALAWVEKIPDPALAQLALTSIGLSAAVRDARAGAEMLLQLPQSNDVRQAIAVVMFQWSDKDWAESARWAVQVEDEELSNWILFRVGRKGTREKFVSALETLPETARETALRRWDTALPAAGKDPAPKKTP
jgi:hypothetical protein